MSTKRIGNKAESVILSEFVKLGIPVSLPFGDNEKYDLIIETNAGFKSVQVKHGTYNNGRVDAHITFKTGSDRLEYSKYFGNSKVDYIAIWCGQLDRSFLVPINKCDKTILYLRVDTPKNNSCISTIVWADDFDFIKVASDLIAD